MKQKNPTRQSLTIIEDQVDTEMDETEFTPININKNDTFKVQCIIKQTEKNIQFCRYILKIINVKVDVIAIIQEKKISQDEINHVINVKVGSADDLLDK
ncbi:unnamed protein product [Rhizophagus irregularis]|nr:unnamed protein product [Rhizophagus irregularis]